MIVVTRSAKPTGGTSVSTHPIQGFGSGVSLVTVVVLTKSVVCTAGTVTVKVYTTELPTAKRGIASATAVFVPDVPFDPVQEDTVTPAGIGLLITTFAAGKGPLFTTVIV